MAKEHTALSLTLPLRTIVTRGKQWYCFICSFDIRWRDLVVLLHFLSCDSKINMLLTIARLCEEKQFYGNMAISVAEVISTWGDCMVAHRQVVEVAVAKIV